MTATCARPMCTRMDTKNTRSVMDLFPSCDCFWLFTGQWQLERYPEVASGQPAMSVPWIERNNSPKVIWPNRIGTRFFLETENSSLYYFAGKMKKWEYIWQLHDDAVATIFYDDDLEDDFRTDTIYILTQRGNVIYCVVDVREQGNQAKVIVKSFNILLDVFPRCSIVDFLIMRTFQSEITQVERQDLRRGLSANREFMENMQARLNSLNNESTGLECILDNDKNTGGMLDSCRELASKLQEDFNKKQDGFKKMSQIINKVLDGIERDSLGATLKEDLDNLKQLAAKTMRENAMAPDVPETLDRIKEKLNEEIEATTKLLLEQEKMNDRLEIACQTLNMAYSLLKDVPKNKVSSAQKQARKTLMGRVDGYAQDVRALVGHESVSDFKAASITDLRAVWERDSQELNTTIAKLRTEVLTQINATFKDIPVTKDVRKFYDIKPPDIEDKLKARTNAAVSAFSALNKRWNVIKDFLPVIQSVDAILYRFSSKEDSIGEQEARQMVNNIFVLTTNSIYCYSSVETPTLMLQRIPVHRAQRRKGDVQQSIFDRFCEEKFKDQPSFQYPAQLVTAAERYQEPEFLLYNSRDGKRQMLLASYSGREWNLTECKGDWTKYTDPIMFYCYTTAGLIIVDKNRVQEYVRPQKEDVFPQKEDAHAKESETDPAPKPGAALWPNPFEHGGEIAGAQYSRKFGLFIFSSSNVVCIDRTPTDAFLFQRFLDGEDFENAGKLATTEVEVREVKYGKVVSLLRDVLCSYDDPNAKDAKIISEKLEDIVKHCDLNLYDVMILLLDKNGMRHRLVKSILLRGRKPSSPPDHIEADDSKPYHIKPDFFQRANDLLIKYLRHILIGYHWKRVVQREMLCLCLVSLYMSRLCEAISATLSKSNGKSASPGDVDWSALTEYNDFCDFVEEHCDILPKDLAYEIVGQYPIPDGLLIIACCGIRPLCSESWDKSDLRHSIDWDMLADMMVQKTLCLMAVPDLYEREIKDHLFPMFKSSVEVLCIMYKNAESQEKRQEYVRDIFQAHQTRLVTSPHRLDMLSEHQQELFGMAIRVIKEKKIPPSATCVSLITGVGVTTDTKKMLTWIREYLEAFYDQTDPIVGERAGLNLLASLKVRDESVSEKEVIEFLKDKRRQLDMAVLAQRVLEISRDVNQSNEQSGAAESKRSSVDQERVKKITAKLFELEGMVLCAFEVVLDMKDAPKAAKLMGRVTDGDILELMFMTAQRRFYAEGSSDMDNRIYMSICRRLLAKPTELFHMMFPRLAKYIPYHILMDHSTSEHGQRLIDCFLTNHEANKARGKRELDDMMIQRKTNDAHENSTAVSIHPYSECDLCHMLLTSESYNIFHCLHKVHIRCMKERIGQLYREENEARMLKECPFCGDKPLALAFRQHKSNILASEYAMSKSEYEKEFRPEYSDDEDID